MSLEDLVDDVESANHELRDATVAFDRETRTELALLVAALGPESATELVRRGVHMLFQSTVDTGKLDFHLRSEYDVTYDEYLSGMTYEEMTGADQFPQRDDERRYQF
ncbi:MAG: hypothetical protein ABEJ70_07425 [Halobacteriaceae archaeon]